MKMIHRFFFDNDFYRNRLPLPSRLQWRSVMSKTTKRKIKPKQQEKKFSSTLSATKHHKEKEFQHNLNQNRHKINSKTCLLLFLHFLSNQIERDKDERRVRERERGRDAETRDGDRDVTSEMEAGGMTGSWRRDLGGGLREAWEFSTEMTGFQ